MYTVYTYTPGGGGVLPIFFICICAARMPLFLTVDSIDLHKIMMRAGGGGGYPSGLTLGLAPIGPVDLCMQKIKNKKNKI